MRVYLIENILSFPQIFRSGPEAKKFCARMIIIFVTQRVHEQTPKEYTVF